MSRLGAAEKNFLCIEQSPHLENTVGRDGKQGDHNEKEGDRGVGSLPLGRRSSQILAS
jgi:hypothetical protein